MNKITKRLNIAFAAAVVGTALIVWFVNPPWKSRLYGVVYLFSTLAVITLYWGCHPGAEFLSSKGKLARASEKVKRRARLIFRVLVLCGSAACFWSSAKLFQDIAKITKDGYESLSPIEGEVLDNGYHGFQYIFHQSVLVRKKGDQYGEDYSLWFSPTLIQNGETHTFRIAPASRTILEIDPKQPGGK